MGIKADNDQLYALIQNWKMKSEYHTSLSGTFSSFAEVESHKQQASV